MKQTAKPKLNIGISHVDTDDYLVMMVSNEAGCVFHQIPLAKARALSLELIKQVYQAELVIGRNGKSRSGKSFSFHLQSRHPT